MTVPTLGSPAAEYRPVGALTEVTRTGVSPPLTRLVFSQELVPTGTFEITLPLCSTSVKSRLVEVANSPVWMPSPTSGTETVPDPVLVVNETAPLAPPNVPGANFTCARSTSPLCRVTGNVTGAVPPPGRVTVTLLIVNGSGAVIALSEAPVTVTVLVAVTVAVSVLAACTVVSAKVAVPLLFSGPPPRMPNP